MRQGQELVLRARPRTGPWRGPVRLEHVGDDGRGGDADLLEQDSVEHTARRAGPSVADAGDDDVDGALGLLDDLRRARARSALCLRHIRVSAAPYSFLRISPIFTSSLSELNLVFSTRPIALALERVRPRHVRQRLLAAARPWDRGSRSLPSCPPLLDELRHRLRRRAGSPSPGCSTRTSPARPPAATTSMSSGLSTSGRSRGLVLGLDRAGQPLGALEVRDACSVVFSKTNFRMSALDQPSAAMVRMCSPASTTHVLAAGPSCRRVLHVVAERRQDTLGGARELVVELVRPLRGHHGHRAVLGPAAALDVQRRPRALRLVLGDHVGVLARVARRCRGRARPGSVPITLRITRRTARPTVALERQPGPKRLSPAVEVEPPRDGPVDDHQDGGAAGGGGGPVIAPPRVGDALDRRHHDRHVLGPAARHDRVDRHLLGAHRHLAIRDEGDLRVRLEARRVQHGAHRRLGGRHDGQAVGPPLAVAELDAPASKSSTAYRLELMRVVMPSSSVVAVHGATLFHTSEHPGPTPRPVKG